MSTCAKAEELRRTMFFRCKHAFFIQDMHIQGSCANTALVQAEPLAADARCMEVPMVYGGANGVWMCQWCMDVPMVYGGANGVWMCQWCMDVPMLWCLAQQ